MVEKIQEKSGETPMYARLFHFVTLTRQLTSLFFLFFFFPRINARANVLRFVRAIKIRRKGEERERETNKRAKKKKKKRKEKKREVKSRFFSPSLLFAKEERDRNKKKKEKEKNTYIIRFLPFVSEQN